MNRINKHQLFSLMLIFEIGSTTLFALGIEAKQDSWISILLGMVIGLGFAWMYTELQNLFPGKNFVEIIIDILGKKIGISLALLYAVYWLWPAARNLREFGELIALTFLPNTPLNIILLTFVITSLYVLSLGVNVFARTSEIITPVIIFFIISIFIMVFISGDVKLTNLAPVLGNGLKPVLKVAYPNISIFPYGDLFIFSMYWCYVSNKEVVRKVTMKVIILSGVLLSITSIVYIAVLGVEFTTIVTIPLLTVVKMINIDEFLTNLDAIGICVIFLGGFYKMSVYLKGVSMALATVFNIKKSKLLLTVVSFFLLFIAIIFEPNYTYHRWMTPFDTNYFYIPFIHIIPIFLLIINWLNNKSGVRA